ncbi:MAG: phosphoglycolate phosphatase-like HAD superfamily hydrolase [Patescibacteria group bacterium]|jgi:phosphoglycolate phosphatase-like HAD superfamily hydrolase
MAIKKKIIIFDFDGVIHDSKEVLFDIQKKFFPEMTYDEWVRISSSANSFAYFEKIFSVEMREIFKELWNEAHHGFIADSHIGGILNELSEQFTLVINSSNHEANLHLFLNNNGLADIFDLVLGNETHSSKVEKFKIIFEKYCVTSDEVIFVTDTLGDILEANEAGVTSIAVTFGMMPRELLLEGKPLRIVDSFTEVKESILDFFG